ncbi:glycosyltransferase family 1 protein [Neobacillus ginsengisoli]|uniref:Glycosyltransferase EpsF n=1 Tax=Neobacillus ginsengisoli TaxID=904295 RepID=A0ABT9XTB0_9BACI|nr:glycosyltransferase family 1 protein [Neobacillus ginsengisoli]MDQ0198785.1 glycosyltransferase EpsF [Neobacillus ginsengisoli]
MEKEPKRILHIVSSMERGGAETLIMNIYRNLDRTKLQFDFITHSNKKGDFDEEILTLGGRIYKIPSLGNLGPLSYIKNLIKIMNSNSYIAVHSHTDYQGGFPALAAKIAGINKRICHSHSNNWSKAKSFKSWVTLIILRSLIKISATNYCSCSLEAAQFLFGQNIGKTGKVSILKNGVDIAQFTMARTNLRNSVINELNLSGNVKIIGHVGRFSDSKNHFFILKVLKKLIEEDDHYVALLIGDGPLRINIEKEAAKLGVLNHIRFLGVRSDIPKLMKAFDVFLFPSKFEGFGIVTIEAQCSGTPCVIADTVPKATDMGLGLTSFVNLDESLDSWCNKIKESILMARPDDDLIYDRVSNRGFNIKNNVSDWVELYGASQLMM